MSLVRLEKIEDPPASRVWWAARWVVGGFFLYSGLAKVMEPAEFLKLLRLYELTSQPVAMNLVAAVLPWFEVFCGLLLVLGIAVRGAALVSVLLLVPFTAVVLHRALGIQEATGLAFCAIRFDCGCGTGEVAICRKLVENAVLLALSVGIVVGRRSRLALLHGFTRREV
jgi:uncharacterized membrane protein YphA (DoxX/SURF4 family)